MKRERKANFTKAETDLLIKIILKYKHIVDNSKTDARIWKDKNEAWEKISEEYNDASENFPPRTTKALRSKYESIKKNIRKKWSLHKSKSTKTDDGRSLVTLTSSEENVLSTTPNIMVGLDYRFDKDLECTESGPNSLRQKTERQDLEKDEIQPDVTQEDIIEFVDDQDDDLRQYLKAAKRLKESPAASESTETSPKTKKTRIKKKIRTEDSNHENETKRGTNAEFISNNKRAKTTVENHWIIQDDLQLRNDILVLKKALLMQEIEAKSKINKLTIENLKLDLHIKKLTKQKLEANCNDDDD